MINQLQQTVVKMWKWQMTLADRSSGEFPTPRMPLGASILRLLWSPLLETSWIRPWEEYHKLAPCHRQKQKRATSKSTGTYDVKSSSSGSSSSFSRSLSRPNHLQHKTVRVDTYNTYVAHRYYHRHSVNNIHYFHYRQTRHHHCHLLVNECIPAEKIATKLHLLHKLNCTIISTGCLENATTT